MKTHVKFGNLYLGNKMTGMPFFNAPWFNATATALRSIDGVATVFNPAEWDVLRGFDPMQCPNGTLDEAIPAGFVLRDALRADWNWIAENSNGLVIGPAWATSKGTISEIACHQALGLPVWESSVFLDCFGAQRFLTDPATLFRPDWQFPPLGVYLV
jgi:hypothetical protein